MPQKQPPASSALSSFLVISSRPSPGCPAASTTENRAGNTIVPAGPARPDGGPDSLPRMLTDTTRVWVQKALTAGERVEDVVRLRGGWTSQMRRLDVAGPAGRRSLVLRSFVKPFFVRHAEGLLNREADVLTLLADTAVPAAELVAVDATARHCDHPSLLMSLLPGTVRMDDFLRFTSGPGCSPASWPASTGCR
ncbi:conserved hypothetical protein [Streptomyces griseoflavus Tu4000]|uniref:Aminoglycoside phosphotransferase domain-containing protein n=1 Tax=Streptomyces griseoflavus Tu4000 TaxID=467200 RepID=D9XKA3_9ACTN|nr:conserved hypothetical protein [Streptomyces griseoflavus Tu4000]